MDDHFKSLGIDEGEWLEDIVCGDSSSASFLACVEEYINLCLHTALNTGSNPNKADSGTCKHFQSGSQSRLSNPPPDVS